MDVQEGGRRVTEEQEVQGLDIVSHGESGYNYWPGGLRRIWPADGANLVHIA